MKKYIPKKTKKSILICAGVILFAAIGTVVIFYSKAAPTHATFTPNTRFWWQLTGTINVNGLDGETGNKVYDTDLWETSQSTIDQLHAKNTKVICYFSAGTAENWRDDFNQFLYPGDRSNNLLPDWDGEYFVDTTSAHARLLMTNRMDLAVTKKCDAIEIDNLDTYTYNSGLPLTEATELDYITYLANAAHDRGLAIGLKNVPDLVYKTVGGKALHTYFDFSLTEQCYQYSECDNLKAFIDTNKAVFIVEYMSNNTNFTTNVCPQAIASNFDAYNMNLALDGTKRIACRTTGPTSSSTPTPTNTPTITPTLTPSVTPTPTPAPAGGISQSIAVPSYFYPGSIWTQLEGGAPTVGLAIINPASGPGATKDTSYASQVTSTKSKSIKVIGYVDTSYGAIAAATVKANIDKYYSWYGVDGIFFDQVSTSCTTATSYYQDIYNYVKAKGGIAKVVLNPGTNTNECYMAVGDIIVNFEDTYASYVNWAISGWETKYPANRFWQLVHTTTQANMPNAIALSKARNAGWIYVTPDVMANPWDTLPASAYWTDELARAAAGTANTILGDVNGDSKVNIYDLSTLLSKWNTSYAACDLNKDNTVNIFDLSSMLSKWTS